VFLNRKLNFAQYVQITNIIHTARRNHTFLLNSTLNKEIKSSTDDGSYDLMDFQFLSIVRPILSEAETYRQSRHSVLHPSNKNVGVPHRTGRRDTNSYPSSCMSMNLHCVKSTGGRLLKKLIGV